jgi:hypothetical protein
VADGDFFTRADEFGEVGVKRVRWDTAHPQSRNQFAGFKVHTQNGGGVFGIFKVQFVEAADTKKEQRVG